MRQSLIKAGRLIDGTGNKPELDQAIFIENKQVVSIKPWKTVKPSQSFLDYSGFTVLPGFIDTHLHLSLEPDKKTPYDTGQAIEEVIKRTRRNARASLKAGVIAVGDCGAQNDVIFPVKESLKIDGLKIFASGQALTPEGGHGAEAIGLVVSGTEKLREAVAKQAELGADFIKVMATGGGGEDPGASHYSIKELTAVREAADQYNLKVAAHAHGTTGIKNCVLAGIQRIEHCTFMDKSGSLFDAEIARDIARQSIIVSPTNVIDYRRMQAQGGSEEGIAPRTALNKTWRKLLEAGVKFAASSDAGVPDIHYDDYALILELMVNELGMTPMDAIIAATRTSAEALDALDIFGTVETGKCADLVVIKGNPLEDISTIRNIKSILLNGRLIKQKGEAHEQA